MNAAIKSILLAAHNSHINHTQLDYSLLNTIIHNVVNQINSIWLNSNRTHPKLSEFDILCAEPLLTITTYNEVTEVKNEKNTVLHSTSECPFDLISKYASLAHNPRASEPFTAGFIGHLSYELGRKLAKIPTLAQPTSSLSPLQVGFYHWSLVINHKKRIITLYYLPINPSLSQAALIKRLTKKITKANNVTFSYPKKETLISNLPKLNYKKAFQSVKTALQNGNCYQINLAQKFQLPYSGNALDLYTYLQPHTQAPFAGFINYPNQQILCFSPERFLKISTTGHIETKPIKGTSPRSIDPRLDKASALALLNSEKDKAENLMIVDLLRNDLGKICLPGTIKVPELFKLESYSVHHLVSKVTGKTKFNPMHVLKACFPGGSITGAPKLSAMRYIEQLEPHSRDIYCGSLFYLNLAGNLDSNITIRTLLLENNTLHFWAGGGIVADSTCSGEYTETFNKVAFILNALLKNLVN